MEIKKAASCGKEAKGDARIEVQPNSNGLEINIQSSLGKLFYKHIAESVEDIANKYSLINAKINIFDDGALDFVLRSRVETAILRASQEVEKKYFQEKHSLSYKLRRTRMYVPGNNPYLMQGIPYFFSDGVILDLEDSVPVDDKDSARMLVSYALDNIDFGSAEKMVRINSLESCGADDIEAIIQHNPDVLLIPKCESDYDVKKVLENVEKFEKKYKTSHSVNLMPIIESAKGVDNAYSIVTATSRICAVAFGAEDYTASLGVKKSKTEEELLFAKQVIVNAAKGAGIQASDTVYSNIEDIEGLKASTERSKALGFDGRGVIHPSQIDIIHQIYMPTDAEIEEANEIIDAYNKSMEDGTGVLKLKGKMIDMPVVIRAMKVIKTVKSLNKEGVTR